MFSYGSSSSISLATVTPSLVMVGEPHFLSSTTLRPLGPRVTLTAFATAFAPASSARRACSSNRSCFAAMNILPLERVRCSAFGVRRVARRPNTEHRIPNAGHLLLDRVNLVFVEDDVVLA